LSIDPNPLRLGFAGTPQFAVPALYALSQVHRICGVFTQPDRRAGRGQGLHGSPVKTFAAERGIRVYQPASFKSPEALEILRSLELDVLVVVAYGLILPAVALACPKKGCINIHASLLPRWRGAAPIQRALLAGDSATGVTIMRMESGLDAGPILASRAIDIGALDNSRTIHDRLARIGAELMLETLDALREGCAREMPQPAEGVTYAAKITKAEALIDWRQDALEIWRRVRAFNPWPVAETKFNGAQLRIFEAEMLDAEVFLASRQSGAAPGTQLAAAPGMVLAATHDGIDVACGRGIVRILRLQLAGRKPILAKEFIKGQRLDGARFSPA
jgi:methionyl-tRNA formyltransferase